MRPPGQGRAIRDRLRRGRPGPARAHEQAVGAQDAVRIGPAAYAAWRSTPLGALTEALEQRLLLELMGELAGRRVLDIGSGDGTLACALGAAGAEVIGLDADPAMLAAAREGADREGVRVTFVEGRLEQLPFPDATFDIVVAVTVLCFMSDAAEALREMARVLRPGGHLVLGELGCWSAWAAIRRLRGWRGSPTWRAAHFRRASELRTLAKEVGLAVGTVRGAVYYPPIGAMARILAPADRALGRRTTIGASFLALTATKAPA